ncbi:hypothetical protein [Conexibacter woesei]|uniref:Uncharacterized protein n=1 Tax=Conexibacter woesei (strain DSM 14684 / CCUG 47730 / CIP 108061 / JCM 11494 / NBRC 100937 / ID131577) TaxID=469383 RepID=D3F9F3_CONWI|nr:hypothetical protein [Conexibacter woesei]ADB49120.1 hypothetical protein Cwoe_0686 [Conexibacter woesei DSM 14684]
MARHLTRQQRDLLHGAILNDLARLSAVPNLVRTGQIKLAKVLRTRCEAQWRLLDDLGWPCEDPRATIELTLPDPVYARALSRLMTDTGMHALDFAEHIPAGDAAERDIAPEHDRKVFRLCEELLNELPADVRGSAAEPFPGEE